MRFDRNVMGKFCLVDGFKDRYPLTDGGYANSLERFGVEHAEDVTGDVVF